MNKKLQELSQALQQSQNKFKEESRGVFKEAAQELFDTYPNLESFSWEQYTPYFNDGDECVFGVNGDYPGINGLASEEIKEGWEWHGTKYPEKNIELLPAKKAVSELLNGMPTELMKDIFGNHKQITYGRNGVLEIEDYSHD
jgi:hypothetical protein